MTEGLPRIPLTGRTITGLAWGIIGGAVGKFAGFLSQIYLGWVLSKEDFALYAIATSCAAVVVGLVNGGTQRVLIQRGQQYDDLAFIILHIAFLFNLLVMVILLSAALPVASWFNAPKLVPMLTIMGVATLISTPGSVLHAKLTTDLRFGLMQGLAICSHIVRYGTTVLFAFFGLGPLSFVLPLVVIAVTDNILVLRAVRRFPPRRPLVGSTVWSVLKDSRWVMLSAFAGALIQNGGNLAVGLIASKSTLGIYFFAFQLTFAFASLIGGTLQSVIMPILAHIAEDTARQKQAFERALSAAALSTSGMATALVIIAPPLIHGLWAGKWDEAISVVQILSLGIPALLVSWISRACIEARGEWAIATCLSTAEGLGTVLVAAAGASIGGLIEIATAVAIFKVLVGLMYIAVTAKLLGAKVWQALLPFFTAFSAAIGALTIGYLVAPEMGLEDGFEIEKFAFIAVVFVGIFTGLAFFLCRRGVTELLNIAVHLLQRLTPNKGSTPQ